MFMEKISIITPSYNSGGFIKETILSVINQSYPNWEMIIVDDCSSDNTLEITQENIKDSRIKLIKNEVNCGAAVCRNIGLENSSGMFIAFIDSDDLWTNNKFHK